MSSKIITPRDSVSNHEAASNPHPGYLTPTEGDVAYSPKTITDYQFLPIAWAIDGASAPDAVETLTSTNSVRIRKFRGDTGNQDVFIPLQISLDLVVATKIQYRVIFFVSEATGPSSEGVAFSLAGATLGNGDLLSSTLGTAVVVSATAMTYAQYVRVATAWSADVTFTDLAVGETALMKFIRIQDNTADTYAQKVGVFGIELKFQRLLAA